VPTYRDQAVILRKLDYGEADRIYTLLTKEHGKLGAIAKGVRRTTSKLGSALELYSRIDVLLAKGRNLDVIAQAQRMGGSPIAADLERTAHAALVVELAERVTEERHPLDGIYELTSWALERLSGEADPRPELAYFLMTAVNLLGYGLQVESCASCGQPLRPEPAAFSPSAGGFLCARCSEAGLERVSVQALKILRVMSTGDVGLYSRLRLDNALLDEVERVLELQLEYHLERRLKSLQVLRQVRSHPTKSPISRRTPTSVA
jgi:DNA repair protein RecO (recombination protein O)